MQIQYQGDEYFKHNPVYHRFADFMGLSQDNRMNVKQANKLAILYDWGTKKAKSDNFNDIVMSIEDMRKKLGVNFTGDTLVNELYKWARLDMDKERQKEEQRLKEEARRNMEQEQNKEIKTDRQRARELRVRPEQQDTQKEIIDNRPKQYERPSQSQTLKEIPSINKVNTQRQSV